MPDDPRLQKLISLVGQHRQTLAQKRQQAGMPQQELPSMEDAWQDIKAMAQAGKVDPDNFKLAMDTAQNYGLFGEPVPLNRPGVALETAISHPLETLGGGLKGLFGAASSAVTWPIDLLRTVYNATTSPLGQYGAYLTETAGIPRDPAMEAELKQRAVASLPQIPTWEQIKGATSAALAKPRTPEEIGELLGYTAGSIAMPKLLPKVVKASLPKSMWAKTVTPSEEAMGSYAAAMGRKVPEDPLLPISAKVQRGMAELADAEKTATKQTVIATKAMGGPTTPPISEIGEQMTQAPPVQGALYNVGGKYYHITGEPYEGTVQQVLKSEPLSTTDDLRALHEIRRRQIGSEIGAFIDRHGNKPFDKAAFAQRLQDAGWPQDKVKTALSFLKDQGVNTISDANDLSKDLYARYASRVKELMEKDPAKANRFITLNRDILETDRHLSAELASQAENLQPGIRNPWMQYSDLMSVRYLPKRGETPLGMTDADEALLERLMPGSIRVGGGGQLKAYKRLPTAAEIPFVRNIPARSFFSTVRQFSGLPVVPTPVPPRITPADIASILGWGQVGRAVTGALPAPEETQTLPPPAGIIPRTEQ